MSDPSPGAANAPDPVLQIAPAAAVQTTVGDPTSKVGADSGERDPLLANVNSNGLARKVSVTSIGASAADDAPDGSTSWQHEFRTIASYALPMLPTFLLQYTLSMTTMISVGHLGTVQLGAASLGAMSSNITGNAICSGLATSLDTLCPQAYGAGRKRLVGLQVQRMILFLWSVCIPIGILWLFAPVILGHIIPDPEVAQLAGQYMRIVWFGLPGFACFAAGKRLLQASGNFRAPLYIILVVAPLNMFLNWLFVWHLGWGFVGAPIALACSWHLLWITMAGYVFFIGGDECWPGFTREAIKNWGPMIRLAIPGFVMIEAEVLSFELLALISSYFGNVALAANSVLVTAINLAFQVPLSLSIGTSTRIAHLIGARRPEDAKVGAQAGFGFALIMGTINVALMSIFKGYLPRLFSSDPRVWDKAAQALPLCAVFLLFDATASCCNGVLRGIGRQAIGSYVSLLCYYLIGLPISLGTAFGAHWELLGLWGGLMIALLSVTTIEVMFLRSTDWTRSVDDAIRRNQQ